MTILFLILGILSIIHFYLSNKIIKSNDEIIKSYERLNETNNSIIKEYKELNELNKIQIELQKEYISSLEQNTMDNYW